MITSPSIAKLAVTPPVVGSVSTEMNGRRASSSVASAAEIFAICMSESVPSCMRAPPEAEKMINALCSSIARSISRVTFSPTAEPIEPPMKLMSIAAASTG